MRGVHGRGRPRNLESLPPRRAAGRGGRHPGRSPRGAPPTASLPTPRPAISVTSRSMAFPNAPAILASRDLSPADLEKNPTESLLQDLRLDAAGAGVRQPHPGPLPAGPDQGDGDGRTGKRVDDRPPRSGGRQGARRGLLHPPRPGGPPDLGRAPLRTPQPVLRQRRQPHPCARGQHPPRGPGQPVPAHDKPPGGDGAGRSSARPIPSAASAERRSDSRSLATAPPAPATSTSR